MTTLKTAPSDRKAAEILLNDLFKHLNAFSNPAHNLSQQELEKYFSSHLMITNNDKPVVHNLNDLLTKVREFHHEYSHAAYSKQQDSFNFDGNKLAVRYNIDLTTKDGKHKHFNASANLTIEHGKISKIEQVLHENNDHHHHDHHNHNDKHNHDHKHNHHNH